MGESQSQIPEIKDSSVPYFRNFVLNWALLVGQCHSGHRARWRPAFVLGRTGPQIPVPESACVLLHLHRRRVELQRWRNVLMTSTKPTLPFLGGSSPQAVKPKSKIAPMQFRQSRFDNLQLEPYFITWISGHTLRIMSQKNWHMNQNQSRIIKSRSMIRNQQSVKTTIIFIYASQSKTRSHEIEW